MDLYHFTWILAALSITGMTLVIHLRMIIGLSISLTSTILWILDYISLGQYPTVTLLSTYALIYSYGLAKHGYKEIKRRRKIDQDRVQIEPIDV